MHVFQWAYNSKKKKNLWVEEKNTLGKSVMLDKWVVQSLCMYSVLLFQLENNIAELEYVDVKMTTTTKRKKNESMKTAREEF